MLTSTIGIKNHERKYNVSRSLTFEQAVYALIEYQFGAIFGGRGNYQSQIMGSRAGAGSGTPFMGARIGDSNRLSFRHDVGVLLQRWTEVAQDLKGGVWALWAEPWDGKRQIASEALDPAFIPAARMIRLGAPESGMINAVWFRPSDTGRVRDHTDGGALGDPFTPLVPDPKTGNAKVRGTLRKGYDYTEIVRLLFGSTEQGGSPSPSVLALANRGELHLPDLRVIFDGTAYEQGKTGGYHHREVLLPTSGGQDVIPWLTNQDPVRKAHTAMLARVRDAKSALRGAGRILLAGSPRPREGDVAKVEKAAAELEKRVDSAYLEHLFSAAHHVDEESWIGPWAGWLSKQAMSVFRTSVDALPSSTSRRLEREVQAESYLHFRLSQLGQEHAASATGESVDHHEPAGEEGDEE